MSNVSKASSSVKKKTIYRVKNWAAYNRALIARGSPTLWLDDSVLSSCYYAGPMQRGAQYTYSEQTIETALTLRRLLHLPLCQTQYEPVLVLFSAAYAPFRSCSLMPSPPLDEKNSAPCS
jgi:hypothetical protein